MGLAICLYIKKAYFNDECQNFIIYGPLGYGKTAYMLHALMEIYKTKDPKVLEKYFAFTPKQFLDMVSGLDERMPVVAWDDAGVWLYYMDYAHPLIKKISKMMQMVRTRTSSIIFTTPMPTLILGKLRNFPQTLTIKISKATRDIDRDDYSEFANADIKGIMPYPRQPLRIAKAYRNTIMPDLIKSRVHTEFLDSFSIMLPNEVYEWYISKRKIYVKQLEADIQKDLPKDEDEKLLNVNAQ